MNYTRLQFRGDGLTYLFYLIGSYFLVIITLYIGAPWVYCWRVRWYISNLYIGNRKLLFNGNGVQVFGLFIWILFATIFTFGLYLPFAKIRIEKWKWENTFFEDEFILRKDYQQNNGENVISTANISISSDTAVSTYAIEATCLYCNSELELEKEDINEGVFNCPVCKKDNKIDRHQDIGIEKGSREDVIGDISIQKISEKNEKDFICSSCKSVITLEEEEIFKELFDCPVCGKPNAIA